MRTSEIRIDQTLDFQSFSGEIDYLSEFLSDFAQLISFNGHIISFFSDNHYFILDTKLLESSAKTLESIKLCCSIGCFSDAHTLIRKLRDDLLQYLYIITVMTNRNPFTDESIAGIQTDNPEKFTDSISKLRFNKELSMDEQAVISWFENTMTNSFRKQLDFQNYMRVLKLNDNINQILNKYNLKEYWERLRKKLNDYVHSNGEKIVRHNVYADLNLINSQLENIIHSSTYVLSFFIALLLMIDSSLISSTDHIDYLESNLTPPPDSQYWIPGFIQEFIDNKIAKLHPELKQYIKDNNVHGMNIE